MAYTVPDGWANYEDTPGNFLLVPPSGTLEGVNAGTSDYIGMYDGIAPASANCDEVPEPGIETTPEAMADWYVSLPGLDTTEPTSVELGGLMGSVFDVALAEGHEEGCPYPGAEGIPMVPLIIGVGPASLHHVACCDITTRLYLLSGPSDETIAIEISDVEGGERSTSLTPSSVHSSSSRPPAKGRRLASPRPRLRAFAPSPARDERRPGPPYPFLRLS